MEREDGLPDLANRLVQVVDRTANAVTYVIGQVGVPRGTLQLHARGEETLDDEVVEVAGDAIAVLVDRQSLPLPARFSEHDVDGGLRGERLGHRAHVVVEHVGGVAPQQVEDSQGLVRGP